MTEPSVDRSAPAAPKRPVIYRRFGDRRIDEWAWLRNRSDPAVIRHLEEENDYTRLMTERTRRLEEQLFSEIVARIQETDETVPSPDGPFVYYTRTTAGSEYPIPCRRPGNVGHGREEVLLDVK